MFNSGLYELQERANPIGILFNMAPSSKSHIPEISGAGDRVSLRSRLRRSLDWAIVPVSAGTVANVVADGLAGLSPAIRNETLRNFLAELPVEFISLGTLILVVLLKVAAVNRS